ncbi:hypothetical protein EVAR_67792_1 [Eumeta japonica]|uniref:Uncharacterized protein n=1 Tax=Eumeta variegata TaxID=151549 RepID=A0A4C1ZYE3_EUMVA|nr:hypothetical protein EVAR_67792_1 [Eumeta japonica]
MKTTVVTRSEAVDALLSVRRPARRANVANSVRGRPSGRVPRPDDGAGANHVMTRDLEQFANISCYTAVHAPKMYCIPRQPSHFRRRVRCGRSFCPHLTPRTQLVAARGQRPPAVAEPSPSPAASDGADKPPRKPLRARGPAAPERVPDSFNFYFNLPGLAIAPFDPAFDVKSERARPAPRLLRGRAPADDFLMVPPNILFPTVSFHTPSRHNNGGTKKENELTFSIRKQLIRASPARARCDRHFVIETPTFLVLALIEIGIKRGATTEGGSGDKPVVGRAPPAPRRGTGKEPLDDCAGEAARANLL